MNVRNTCIKLYDAADNLQRQKYTGDEYQGHLIVTVPSGYYPPTEPQARSHKNTHINREEMLQPENYNYFPFIFMY